MFQKINIIVTAFKLRSARKAYKARPSLHTMADYAKAQNAHYFAKYPDAMRGAW